MESTLDVLGRNQHGLVTREQALAVMSPEQLRRRVRSGEMIVEQPGVLRLQGSPSTYEQRLLAATMRSGATVSHRSAAHVWRLLSEVPTVVDVTVAYPRHPRLRHVTLHRSRDLTDDQTITHRGLRVTNPMRSLVDFAGVARQTHVVEDALERGLVARLFSVAAVETLLTRLGRSGRDGCGPLGTVLDDRALGADRAEGLLEPRMARLIRTAGLPEPLFQHSVRVGRQRYRIDFAYPHRRIAIEVDGYEVHATARALRSDLERQNRLVAAGWTVVRFTWHDVVRRPSYVASTIAALL